MFKKRVIWFIWCLMALLAGFLLGSRVSHRPAEEPTVELRIDTMWCHDTIVKPGPVLVWEEVREVTADIDTMAIVQAYYTTRIMADTFRLRDMAEVHIVDTLVENKIIGRYIDYDLAQLDISYDIHETRKGTPARLALTVGVQLGREHAALMGGVRFKRTELGAGYDFRLHAPSLTLKYDILQWR